MIDDRRYGVVWICETEFAARLDRMFRDRLRESVPTAANLIDGRGLAARLRDGAARLLIPYLKKMQRP